MYVHILDLCAFSAGVDNRTECDLALSYFSSSAFIKLLLCISFSSVVFTLVCIDILWLGSTLLSSMKGET